MPPLLLLCTVRQSPSKSVSHKPIRTSFIEPGYHREQLSIAHPQKLCPPLRIVILTAAIAFITRDRSRSLPLSSDLPSGPPDISPVRHYYW